MYVSEEPLFSIDFTTQLMRKIFFRSILLIGLCILASQNCHSQISDSLYKALPDSLKPKDRNKVDLMEKQYIFKDIYDFNLVALRFGRELGLMANELDKAAYETGSQKFKVETFCALGNFYHLFHNDEQAVLYYKKTISTIGDSKDYNDYLMGVNTNIASFYFSTKDRDDSTIFYLHKSLQVPNANKDSVLVSANYYIYAQIYARLHLFEKALSYTNLSLENTPTTWKKNGGFTSVLIGKSKLYILLYNETKNKLYTDSCKRILYSLISTKKEEAANWYLSCYCSLEIAFYFSGDYKKCMAMADSAALPVYNRLSLGFPNHYFAVGLFKALSLIQLDEFVKGKKILDTLIIPNLVYKQEMYKVLYQYAEKKYDWKKAYSYFQQYKAIADSLNIEGQKGVIFESEQKYSVSKKEADIAKLESNNLLQEKAKRNIASGAIIATLILIIALLLLYQKNKKNQVERLKERESLTEDLHKITDEMNLERTQLQIENTAEIAKQKKAISQNMHDEVSSSLVALRYYVADLQQHSKDKSMKAILADIEQEAQQVYLQARNFMHRLQNSAIQTQYNVIDFLKTLATRFGSNSSLYIVTTVDAASIKQYFTPTQHKEMYMVINEAVANTIKHAAATRMEIQIGLKENYFYFNINDNGKAAKTVDTKGMGLKSIAQRIKLLNGDMDVTANENGMAISGSFPVDKADQ